MNILNRNTIKLSILALIIVSGCSKDLPQASLVGTWKLTRFIAGGCFSDSDNGKVSCTSGCDAVITASTFTFPSFVQIPAVYNYTAAGGTLKLTGSSVTAFDLTYQLTVSTLILAFPADTFDDGCIYTLYFTKS
jgi:hypothetical protein